MNIQAEKLNIIQWLAGVNDSNVIRQFMLLKESNEKTGAVKLTQTEKTELDKGLKSIKEGRVKSDKKVKDITRKKYPQLFK